MFGFLAFMGDLPALLKCQKSNLEIKKHKFSQFWEKFVSIPQGITVPTYIL
jgi:hypothetical protein